MTIPDSTSRNESDSADRERAGDRARRFFDSLWNQGDYWKLETCAFDQARYARLMELPCDRRYSRTLEIGYLLRPWVIRTYRDLCVNVGFLLEREEVFHGTKDDIQLDVLISLLRRPPMTTQSISGAA